MTLLGVFCNNDHDCTLSLTLCTVRSVCLMLIIKVLFKNPSAFNSRSFVICFIGGPQKRRETPVESLLFTFQSARCFYFCLWMMLELLFRWEMDFSLVLKQPFSRNQIGSGEIHRRKRANKIELCVLYVVWIIFSQSVSFLSTVWRQRLCCKVPVVSLLTWREQ